MYIIESQTDNRKRTWSWAQQETDAAWTVGSGASAHVVELPCMPTEDSEPAVSLDSYSSNHATVCVRFEVEAAEDETERSVNFSSSDSNDSPKSQLAKLDTISSYIKHNSTVMQKVVYDKKRRICMQEVGWEDDSCFSVGPGCPL